MKGLIINADDFGLSPGVNRGILSAFVEGVLTSTTMLVNLPSFDDAVSIARDHPELPVGIHLSLLWGAPVSAPTEVSSLVDRGGCLPRSLTTLARRYYLGLLSIEHVETEFRNQIRKFLDAGLVPTHLDTHKHVHCLPGIMRALISVAGEFGVDKMRLPYENGLRLASGGRPSWNNRAKRNLIRFLCRNARDRLRHGGMKTTDHFVGIDYMDCLGADVLREILRHLRDGVTEVMCHPGYADDTLRAFARVPLDRERELAGLKDPEVKTDAASGSTRLMHYGEL